MHDHDSKEVYEDDVVEWWDVRFPDKRYKYTVKWNTARFLLVRTVQDVRDLEPSGKYHAIKVIGSIHDTAQSPAGKE